MKKIIYMLTLITVAVVAMMFVSCGRETAQSNAGVTANENASGDMMNGMTNDSQQSEMMMK